MNYYRRYSGDYLRDTSRLNLTDHGAYTLLLDYYYTEEKPLPLDHEELFLMVRAMREEDRAAVEKVLRLFFTKRADGYHQKRVDHEIAVSKQARTNGKKGGRPQTGDVTEEETGNATGDGTDEGTEGKAGELPGLGHPPTSNHQPPASNNQPPVTPSAKPSASPSCPHEQIIGLYHELLPMGRTVNVKLWNGTRAKHLQARWREDKERQTLDWWRKFFGYCAESAFLTGKVPPRQGREPFQVSLDWLISPDNFVKVHEGVYNR
jgi:uncharacterized protein YdaU (DUF1376 family)